MDIQGAIRWILGIAILLGFIACGHYLTWDWDKALLGFHGFRQTQTAITCYWFMHEGYSLDYQTPVLGKPWGIPFEFPFYQVITALVDEIAMIDLDRAGRLVSVLFWIACLYPLNGILRWWVEDRVIRWAFILLLWSSPTYIYWSDSFMIESTALFFSLTYIYSLVRSIKNASSLWLLLAIFCGLMAGLQKATTFLIVLFPAVAFSVMQLRRQPSDRPFWRNLLLILIAVVLPLAAVDIWTHHADAVKQLNPMADNYITSKALAAWNFGTLAQKESLNVWMRIFQIETVWGFGRGSLVLLLTPIPIIALALWRGRHRLEIIVWLVTYLTGPLIFTNLFFIHEYYNFETSLFLELAFGLPVIDLVQSFGIQPSRFFKKWKEWGYRPLSETMICCTVFLGISALGLWTYHSTFVPFISNIGTSDQARLALWQVSKAGEPKDILLIYGLEWDSTVPYYSGRKALMIPTVFPPDSPATEKSLELLSPDQGIAALIVSGPLSQNRAFIEARVRRFHLQSTPITLPWGVCYLKTN